MGRGKVEMKKITNKNSRFVTFSKRRSGLFKKAVEISTLCGTDVTIIIFSPSGKPFSFGQPSVDEVTDRFLELGDGDDANETGGGSAKAKEMAELSEQLEHLNVQLKSEKQKEKRQKREMEAEAMDIGDLEVGELRDLKARLEKIREAASKGIGEIENEASNTLVLLSNFGPNS